ncbi:tetratricopeptide repeat protein [Lysobacter brunescens]|uniref:Tetratricopeptide repeat protein n=1 Tax=Lysobacter brunescens TaxID=262323 RepID=A0ABW2YFJ2_9GAMM
MRIRPFSLAMVIFLATGCSEAYNPQPQLSSAGASPGAGLPDCAPSHSPYLEGFSIIVDILRRNGEVERSQGYFQRVRARLEAQLADADPAGPARAKPALDALFSAGEIEKLAVCAFIQFDRAQPEYEAWDAWSLDARMREIHAAIVDIGSDDIPQRASSVPDARRAQLLRVSRATDLRVYLHALTAVEWQIVAIAEAALDPSSSLGQDLAMNGDDLGVPPEQVIVDHYLAKALDDVSDADLQRFLAFAESREGQAYYQTLRDRYFRSAGPWGQRLSAALKSSVQPKAVERDPAEAAKLLAEARRLYDQVGTRVVVPEARTLLLRAEQLDPDNADIQVLLARIAFRSLPRIDTGVEGQIRAVIDRMHPARPQDYAEIEGRLRRAIELDPKHAEAHLYLGRSQFLQSKDDEATRLYALSRKLDPKGPTLAYFEADLAYVRGDYAKAERIHRQILAAPEVRAYDHYYSLGRLRHVLAKQGREREFREVANAQLKRHPDMWDFRLDQARRLIQTDGTVAEIEAMIAPVPERWLPDAKRDLEVRLQLLRAGAAAPAQRAREVQRAYDMAESSPEVVDAACYSRVRQQIAAEVVAASDQPSAAADNLLACGMWGRDRAFIERVLPMVKDIDQPNAAMQGGRPLCSAAVLMDPVVFETILKAKPDTSLRCGDGKTVREFLAERATRPDAEPAFKKAAKDMLALLDRHDGGR